MGELSHAKLSLEVNGMNGRERDKGLMKMSPANSNGLARSAFVISVPKKSPKRAKAA